MAETITVDDRAFDRAFHAELGELDKICETAGMAVAKRIVGIAQADVNKRTEKLELDIEIRGSGRDDEGYYVDVGTTTDDVGYGVYQEFGTKENGGKPFMRPAIAEATRNGLPVE